MKAIITGGAGFIGSHIVDLFIENNIEVVIIDNLSTGCIDNLNKSAKFFKLDIGDDVVSDIFNEEKPDYFIHTAAQASVAKSVREPEFDAVVNIVNSVKLLKYSVSARVKKVVFSSSGGTIYGEVPGEPAVETAILAPLSPYGISKMSFEYYLKFFKTEFELDYTTLRYANVYGPRQDPYGEAGVIAIFAKSMLEGKIPTINGDGKYFRDYVYVSDVARANLIALTKDAGESYNIGTATITDVIAVYDTLSKVINFPHPPDYGPPRSGDLRRSVLNINKTKSELGWAPEVEFADGIRKTVEFFKQQKQNDF